ncbi:hypothetical protein [Streptomyces erythrochromogenes]|uniref:hypothetical protein n=1 Tax=Streptomyces erythrochromogenes TaxID=285574 RepID=UPI003866D5C3|nr:hypothetical protein OG364_00890 [Streptomyces erythrochromogenes]WST98371.1 hypothetical protein OG364_40645 [Streptomyces erythrochromogenes]
MTSPTALRTEPDRSPTTPSEREWGDIVDRLHELLAPLEWAGFELPEAWDSEFDPEPGTLLYGDLWRGDGCVSAEYRPHEGVLALRPFEDVTGDHPHSYTLLDDEMEIGVAASGSVAVEAVARAAGRAGLLDATHVRVAESAPQSARQDFAIRRIRGIFQPAAADRDVPLTEILREVSENTWLSDFLEMVVGMAGHDVAPDIVPDAAALGVAAWCWRNNTAVEAHHLDTDVLMARTNIAVTRVTQQHVCPVEGIDWDGIESSLMDPAWALPDGTTIRSLFGTGWDEVADTVTAELRRWRHMDHTLLGLRTTLILMTIAGSTGYTDSWWGQARWPAMCHHVVDHAVRAGLDLPAPYDLRGVDSLLADLADPDLLPDDVLDWVIGLPQASIDGPRGLRFNPITRPPQRCWDPYWLEDNQP